MKRTVKVRLDNWQNLSTIVKRDVDKAYNVTMLRESIKKANKYMDRYMDFINSKGPASVVVITIE